MLKPMLRSFLLLICLVMAATPAWPVAVDKPLDDPALEARARDIHKQLRCLVCQNQSIEDSNAPLARDLRILVRERIAAGDDDEAAVRFVVDRYGDWVLLQPPVKGGTILLWLGPAIFLVLALGVIAIWFRRRRSPSVVTSAPLTEAEKSQLQTLLNDEERQ